MLTRGGVVAIPAVVALGFWIFIQFISGLGSFVTPEMGGVAYLAHIGGFVAGLILIMPLAAGRRRQVAVA